MTRADEFWSHHTWTVDCRTGTTTHRVAPIPTPQDRDEEMPTLSDLEVER